MEEVPKITPQQIKQIETMTPEVILSDLSAIPVTIPTNSDGEPIVDEYLLKFVDVRAKLLEPASYFLKLGADGMSAEVVRKSDESVIYHTRDSDEIDELKNMSESD